MMSPELHVPGIAAIDIGGGLGSAASGDHQHGEA